MNKVLEGSKEWFVGAGRASKIRLRISLYIDHANIAEYESLINRRRNDIAPIMIRSKLEGYSLSRSKPDRLVSSL